MVGVSVCHHIRVGIRSRKAALPELCGLPRESCGQENLCSGEKRRNSFSAATRKAVFSGKVKDIECASLSLNILLNGMLAQHYLSNPVVALLLKAAAARLTQLGAWLSFTELTLLKPCSEGVAKKMSLEACLSPTLSYPLLRIPNRS